MSTPDPSTNPPHNPFGLLKAILIGSALGFFAVIVIPYVLPHHRGPVSYATAELQLIPIEASAAPSHPPRRHSLKTAEADPGSKAAAKAEPGKDQPTEAAAPGESNNEGAEPSDGQPHVPAVPKTGNVTPKGEPVLIPAVNLKFPKPFSNEEMTAALQPLLSFKISDDDAAAVKEVISNVVKGDDTAARAAIKKISDPAAKAFAEWRRLRPSNADFDEVMAFRKAHPLFPEPIQEPGFEKSLFFSDASAADILKFYTNRNPMTGAGKASLGAALIESGERERGLGLIKFAWSRYNLDPAVQERFVARFGSLLDESDQHRRKLLIEARARQLDDPNKKLASASEGKGLKGAVRLRSKKTGRQALRGGRHGRKTKVARRGRGRRHGEIQDGVFLKEAALSGKARGFDIAPLANFITLKKEEEKGDEFREEHRRQGRKRKPALARQQVLAPSSGCGQARGQCQ